MRIFFSVGEPSGDMHGANFIRELKSHDPQLEAVGYGGPRMAEAGCRLHDDLTRLAVMWLSRVVRNLPTFLRLLRDAKQYFRQHKPDAVVLIDYPGFNWWIARHAKAQGIPVFYYGVPQMWAWAGWRVRKMRRLVDHVLCKLPFEEKWYRERGCNATFVGHPYFDELQQQQLDPQFVQQQKDQPGPLVTILPGSRTQEVNNNLNYFIKSAAIVRRQVPAVRFAIASFNSRHAELARAAAAEHNVPVDVYAGRTPELIHAAHCCMACSGSVSLELLYHTKPTVILYWLNRWWYYVTVNILVKVKYITLVNLLADEDPFTNRPTPFDPTAPGAERVPFPEYPTYEDKSEQLAGHVVRWLTDAPTYAASVSRLQQLKQRFCKTGASATAAEYVFTRLCQQREDRQSDRAA